MKRLSVAILAALILIASFAADAQTAAAPMEAAAAAPAPSAEALAAAKNLMVAMKMREVMTAAMQQASKSIPQILNQMTAANINGNPKLSAEQKKEALAMAQVKIPEMSADMQVFLDDPKMVDEMVAEIVPIYARNFTVDEIKHIIAFYNSPAGAKLLRVMPQMMNETMMVSQKVTMPRIAKVMEKVFPPAAK